jgi:hypothetical protein
MYSTRPERLPRDATIEKLLGEMFSMRSVPRLYNLEHLRLRESLETAVRRVGGWREIGTSLRVRWNSELAVRESPACKDVNTEAEDATALKAVTRRQPVKTQQTEKA